MYALYANPSNNTPSYTHISSNMVCRVHPQGIEELDPFQMVQKYKMHLKTQQLFDS